ncbi:hypothetical protein GCM10027202_11440 [Microvirgula curvata]
MPTPVLFKTGRHLLVSGFRLGKTAALSILVGSAPLGEAAERNEHPATSRARTTLPEAPPPCLESERADSDACPRQPRPQPDLTLRYGAIAAGGAAVVGSLLAGGGKSGGKEEGQHKAQPVTATASGTASGMQTTPQAPEQVAMEAEKRPPVLQKGVEPPPAKGVDEPPPTGQDITISHDRHINGKEDSPHRTLDISGGQNAVTVTGKTTLNGGQAGIAGTGNNLSVTLHGSSEIHDNDSRAAHLSGDHARIRLSGNTRITAKGTGIDITGNDAEVVHSGRMEVLHAHAAGTRLTGDMARYIEQGRLDLHTPQGHGVQVTGNNALLHTEPDSQIDVTHSATALSLAGDRGAVRMEGRMTLNRSATGLALTGHRNLVKISSGDIRVRGGNSFAVKVRGNSNKIELDGTISLRPDELRPARQLAEPLTAMWIKGNDNHVDINSLGLDGQLLRLDRPRWLARHGNTFGITARSNGLRIEGDGNQVWINGPVFYRQVTKPLTDNQRAGISDTDELLRLHPGLMVDVNGKSSVLLKHKINIRGAFASTPTLFRASNGATLTLVQGASLETGELRIMDPVTFPTRHALMEASGAGSVLDNSAHLTLHGGAGLAARNQGLVENNSQLSSRLASTLLNEADATMAGPLQGSYLLAAIDAGSTASNRRSLTVSLDNNVAAHKTGSPSLVLSQFNATRPGNTAMLAVNAGTASNEAGSTIRAEGVGAGGMSAHGGNPRTRTLARNLGSIVVNPVIGRQLTLRDSALSSSDGQWEPLAAHEYALGMSAGSQRASGGTGGPQLIHATAINDGQITVHNAGVGMAASGKGSMALNRGTIRLVSDDGVQTPPDGLYGMLALNGGLIVNAREGSIDMDTPVGKAFRLDSGGMLINQGKVRVGGHSLSAGHSQWGAATNAELTEDFALGKGLPLTPQGITVNADKPMFSPGVDMPAVLRSDGKLMLRGLTLTLSGNDQLINTGKLVNGTLVTRHNAMLVNSGTLDNMVLQADAPLSNEASGRIRLSHADPSHIQALDNSGRLYPGRLSLPGPATNAGSGVILMAPGATLEPGNHRFTNAGEIRVELRPGQHGAPAQTLLALSQGRQAEGEIINTGTMEASDGFAVLRTQNPAGPARILFANRGMIRFSTGHDTTAALQASHDGLDLLNDAGATLEINGDRAIGMFSNGDGQLINRGTINVGQPGSPHTGLVAMALGPDATGTLVNDSTGTIVVHAGQSSAFHIAGSGGKLINRGQVLLQCGDGGTCTRFRDDHTRGQDITGSAEDKTFVFQARIAESPPAARQMSPDGYEIGTTASGGAGTLSADGLSVGNVAINTRFTAGTSARQVVFDKVFVGKNLSGAGNIRATSAVWRAHGHYDADGHIGVTLVKNDYRDLITDASLAPVAGALERSYSSNALFRSLELPGRDEFTRALRQLSGAGIERTLRSTAALEHRFGLMAGTVSEDATGFGVKLLGRGQHGSRLGASAHDMLALQQRFESGTAQLAIRYGFARVSPDGQSRDAALDGHSQFFGVRHVRPLSSGLALESDVGYVLHQYRTQRTLRYGNPLDRHDKKDASRQPQADHRRDLLGSQVNLALAGKAGSVMLEPLLGVKLRYQRDGALKERHGGDFGLRLSSRHQVALDGVLGLRLSHDGRDGKSRGWRLDAQFHARPTLLRHTGQREASLAGAPDARFALAPASGSRFNHDSRLGLRHDGRHSQFSLNGYLGRNDGESDRGMTANWLYRF